MTTAQQTVADLDDRALVDGFLAGDETCLETVHRRWGPLVYALAWRSLGDAREAEDVSQLVFLAAWRGRLRGSPPRGA